MEPINPLVRRWQQDAAADPDAFWGRAAEALPWFRHAGVSASRGQ